MRCRPVPLLLALSLLAVGCQRAAEAPPRAAAVELQPGGIAVAPGEPLQTILDEAAEGAVLTLLPGVHRGPLRITRRLTLQGPRDAVLDAEGRGTALQVVGNGIRLAGFTVRRSGTRLEQQDSAVSVEGHDIAIEGLSIDESLFGVLVQKSERVVVRGNAIHGTGGDAMGLRGDGIRLWETKDSVVADNVVRDHRDVVVWYSSRNRVTGNTVERCRYGTHFMFSHENVVEDNRYIADVVGVFVMYSHDLQLRRNLLAQAAGAAGIGLGVKESGNLQVEDNWFVQDTTGIYLDASPLDPAHHDRFRGNVVRLCDTALHLHASMRRNEFVDNLFADNGALIAVGGDGDALGCAFRGNYFDTYQGYDLDGDGLGDVPFECRQLSSQLEGRYPDLALLHGTPAMAAVDLVGSMLPLFAPRLLLTDPAPRLAEPSLHYRPADREEVVEHAR